MLKIKWTKDRGALQSQAVNQSSWMILHCHHLQSYFQVNNPFKIRHGFSQGCKLKSCGTGTYSYVGTSADPGALTRWLGTTYSYVGTSADPGALTRWVGTTFSYIGTSADPGKMTRWLGTTYSYVGTFADPGALTRWVGTGTNRYVGICGSRRCTDKVSRYRYLQV